MLRWILFGIFLGLAVLGALWLLQNPSFESAIAFLTGLGGLCAEFFIPSRSNLVDIQDLEEKAKDELITLARRLKISGYSSLTKEQLTHRIQDVVTRKRNLNSQAAKRRIELSATLLALAFVLFLHVVILPRNPHGIYFGRGDIVTEPETDVNDSAKLAEDLQGEESHKQEDLRPKANELHTIKTMGDKDIPRGTTVGLRLGTIPGTLTVSVQLPGQKESTTYPDLPVNNGQLVLPVPLVFLCHADQDKRAVERIDQQLREKGCLTWSPSKDILPGDDWKAKIEDAMNRADRVIVFLSDSSLRDDSYVGEGLRYAFVERGLRPKGERYIIPMLLEEVELPTEFQRIQWVCLWEEDWFEKLLQSIRD